MHSREPNVIIVNLLPLDINRMCKFTELLVDLMEFALFVIEKYVA